MPNWLDRLAVRALPGVNAGLGMTVDTPTGKGKVKAATTSSRYVNPGQPLDPDWNAETAAAQYAGHTYVMRCVRLRADTIAGLPFRAGPDPDDPSVTTPGAPLGRLLGPATPQEPGGPNPTTSARALWAWTITQRVVTGRMGWELQRDTDGQIVSLWPLVSAAIKPIPSKPGAQQWWSGYEYWTPLGRIPLTLEQTFYAWRPSIADWRQPESDLQAARLPIQVAMACDRYMWSMLRNGMVASKLVITPPFAEEDERRAWEEQFFSEFSGFDNAGKTVFAEAENDYDSNGRVVDQASVQVVDLSMSSVDAQLLQLTDRAKSDINIALGVPKSLIGDASQRIYANADSEYRNFWALTAINDCAELQDDINLQLAPQLGSDVGWFDLSRVVALQPPTIFQPPALKDAIDEGVVTPQQAADLLGIPADAATGEDTDTAPIGEESGSGGQVGQGARSGYRSLRVHGQGSRAETAPAGWVWKYRPVTTYTYRSGKAGWGLVKAPRERITAGRRSRPVAARPVLADSVLETVDRISRRRHMGIRSGSGVKVSGIAVKAADTGRVLMLQRALDPTDPASGRWEFPGGHIEPGEDSYDAAAREWQEEVGVKLPDGNHAGMWTSPNGVYRGHVLVIPAEADVACNLPRPKIKNPDNPKMKYRETAAWFDPDHITGNPSVRDEVHDTASTWLPVIAAAHPVEGVRSLIDDVELEQLGDALALAMEGAE